MIAVSPGQYIFSIGELSVSWYGFFILLGILTAFFVIIKLVKKTRLDVDACIDILFWSLLIGLLGARLYHVWNEWWWYQSHLGDIVKIWQGGLAIHGAFLAGGITAVLYAQRKRIRFLRLLDIVVPGIALGQAIGRFGNYFNQELFGKPFDGFLALQVSQTARPAQYAHTETFHPLFLYEMILNLLLFTVLWFFLKKHTPGDGRTTAVYLIGYGTIRFLLDFLRFDQFGFGALTLAQWVSLGLILIGYWLFVRKKQ